MPSTNAQAADPDLARFVPPPEGPSATAKALERVELQLERIADSLDEIAKQGRFPLGG